MNNISFTSAIRPVETKDFSQYKMPINRDSYVDFPWTISTSRVARDVYTTNICDCTGVLITTGEKALLMHLNPAVEDNHCFSKILNYISQNVDLKDENLQAVVIGSKSKSKKSSDIFNKFTKFFEDYGIPATILRNGRSPVNIAYRTCTDEVIISNKKMDKAIKAGQSGMDALTSGFEEVNIAKCDYVV